MPNGDIVYDDGELSLVYHNGSLCHGKYQRETHIHFVCDHKSSYGINSSAIQYINETYDCAYHFIWTTSLACLPFHITQCLATDGSNNYYELSLLTLMDDNYEVVLQTTKQMFVINVCTTLVQKKGTAIQYISQYKYTIR